MPRGPSRTSSPTSTAARASCRTTWRTGARGASMDEAERRDAIDGLRLAYLDEVTVNWCPALGTVLANEEVTADGRSEQGDFPVYRRPLRQWMMRITAYADRLIADLDTVDWPESLKAMQRNWIGRSAGRPRRVRDRRRARRRGCRSSPPARTRCTASPSSRSRPSTRCSTPACPTLPRRHAAGVARRRAAGRAGRRVRLAGGAVADARERASRHSDRQREADAAHPAGVFTGLDAVHPLTGEHVPVFAAEHVLAGYGSGAVMGVPAHDTRDFALARALAIPMRPSSGRPRRGSSSAASRPARRPRSGRRRTPGTASRPAPAARPTAGRAARPAPRSCAS